MRDSLSRRRRLSRAGFSGSGEANRPSGSRVLGPRGVSINSRTAGAEVGSGSALGAGGEAVSGATVEQRAGGAFGSLTVSTPCGPFHPVVERMQGAGEGPSGGWSKDLVATRSHMVVYQLEQEPRGRCSSTSAAPSWSLSPLRLCLPRFKRQAELSRISGAVGAEQVLNSPPRSPPPLSLAAVFQFFSLRLG